MLNSSAFSLLFYWTADCFVVFVSINMNVPRISYIGFNGFEQFHHDRNYCVTKFEEWNYLTNEIDIHFYQICSCWSFNAVAINGTLKLFGCFNGLFHQEKQFMFEDTVKQVTCNDNLCLVLLKNRDLYKISINDLQIIKLNFLIIEQPLKRKLIFEKEAHQTEQTEDRIEHISCGETFCVVVTIQNRVYRIPSMIFQFPKHVKIKKISCGAEHALMLTSNGDLYAFGSSSRGQLGLGTLDELETPTLLDALAGIKIVDTAAGAWHSAAISVFGDLYVWGWNLNGQMGQPVYDRVEVTYGSGRTEIVKHKLQSVFASPIIANLLPDDKRVSGSNDNLNDQFEADKVFCGHRHTIVLTKCGRLLGSGWNKYGQLGFENVDDDIVRFSEISHTFDNGQFDVICGNWSTLIVSQKK